MVDDWVQLSFDEHIPFETLQRWDGVEWDKQPPRMLKDLSSEPREPVPIRSGRQATVPRRLDRFRDVHLTWSNFFVAGNRCASIYDDTRAAVAGIADWPGLSQDAGVFRRGNEFVVPKARLDAAEHISGRTMFASSNEPHNWGMWLLYVVPAAMRFVENRRSYDKLFVYADHPNMRAMLRLLGLKAADVVLHDCSRTYHFESVDVFRQPRRDFHVGPEARAMFAGLREQVAGSIVVPSGRHLYVGRRRRTLEMNAYRGLVNEDELVSRLSGMGYNPIDPEYLGPEEQIELFGSERRLVVLGGAALFNAVFCKPGTRIVDIESSRDHIENHSTVLSSMGVDYSVILGQADGSDEAAHNKRWTLDVERAVAAISGFMG